MTDPREMLIVMDIAQRARMGQLRSTGATVVNFASNLYNLEGSTDDPKRVPDHLGVAWKQLLIDYGIADTSPCYVTNAGAEGSHPAFSVGGHMTTNSDGTPPAGGICYLMPLCFWHNNTSRDRVSFTHTATQMLQLSGYMQGELAATFRMRLPSLEPYAILYFTNEGWKTKNLSNEHVQRLGRGASRALGGGEPASYYLLFRRDPDTHALTYVNEVNLVSYMAGN